MPIFACLILRINVISLPLPSGYLESYAKTGVSYSGILPDGSRVGIMRMKIATTLAQGIAFLHDKVKQPHVHQDIHADNVLLDEEFGAHLMGVSVKVCAMGSDAGEDSNGSRFDGVAKYIRMGHTFGAVTLLPRVPGSWFLASLLLPLTFQKVVDLVYACTQHVPSMRSINNVPCSSAATVGLATSCEASLDF
ncbi:hypothetical protein Q3G72_032678 [Acer saccharum]|nr:hypothetical protein Q3G72_032678 [Acer saccharum]